MTIKSDGFYYLGRTRDLMRLGDKINPIDNPEKWGKIAIHTEGAPKWKKENTNSGSQSRKN